ncbi:MAG: hypothetical protein ACKO57_01730, partial [Alphaproteobacteria bacterium]
IFKRKRNMGQQNVLTCHERVNKTIIMSNFGMVLWQNHRQSSLSWKARQGLVSFMSKSVIQKN